MPIRDKNKPGITQQSMGFHDEGNDGASYNEKQRRLMAEKRAAEKEIIIDRSTIDWDRRNECSRDPLLFCKTYFSDTFSLDWCDYHYGIVEGIKAAIHYEELFAVAAPRGGGKSSLAKCVGGVWATVNGHADWVVPIEANTEYAVAFLEDVKSYFEIPEDEDAEDLFGLDYPEVCTPIRVCQGSTRRHEGQTYQGNPTRLVWGTNLIVLPVIPGFPGSGARITPKGVDKAIRGLARRSMRPRLVLMGDIETDETAESLIMTENIRKRITKGVLGLGGQTHGIGVVMTSTILNNRTLAARWTDAEHSPEWHGKRYKFFDKFPDRNDMWDKYLQMMATDRKEARDYYIENRIEMDAGAIVTNPQRYTATVDAEGNPAEVSAIQHGYNLIYKMGMEAFMSEMQNDPQKDIETLDIDVKNVQHRVNGIPRGIVPDWADMLVGFVDVHGRHLEYTIRAFAHGGTSHVVDYGSEKVDAPLGNLKHDENKQSLSDAILTALLLFRDNMREIGWYNQSGKRIPLKLCLVDSGYMPETVYRFCMASGSGWAPYKGWGTSSGQSKYREPEKAKQGNKYKGSHYYASLVTFQDQSTGKYKKIWVYHGDADYWKKDLHDSLTIPIDRPGYFSVFGNDPLIHHEYAKQLLAEVWVSEFIVGKGPKEGWMIQYRKNHWFDGTYGTRVAAAIAGLRQSTVRQLKKAVVSKLPKPDKTIPNQTKPVRKSKRTKKRKKVTYC